MEISIKVTIPKEILRQQAVQDSIALFMTRKTAPEVKALFRGTVYDWANKPSFRQKLTRRAGYMSETVWADGANADQYQIVNAGSPPHLIPVAGNTPMSFRPGYRASTSPGSLTSRRNYRSGPYIYATKITKHMGFPARNFDEAIKKQYEPTFRSDMQDAINAAVKK